MKICLWNKLHYMVTHPASDRIVSSFQRLCGVGEGHRSIFLFAYFRLASACGDEIFNLIPALFWLCPEISLVFITNFGITLTMGQVMKDLLKLPRPEGDRSYEIKKLETHYGTEYGMPSTHTMAGFLPLTVFLRLFKRGFSVPALVWVACIWHILSVALSRLYMGVHSIVDLLSGAVLAALCTYAIHSAGDSLDEFLYLSPESIYLWIMLISFFIVHYPSTEPWSASTCTACQIFGLTAGLGTAVWYSHTYFPKSWEILLENSVLKTIEGGTTFHAITVLLRVLSASVVTLIVKTLSKMVLNPICLTIFKRYFYGTYNPKLMKDSSGNEIAIEKLYPVEISVRLIGYGLTAWSVIIAVPIMWESLGLLV